MKTVTLYTDGACSGNPGPGGWGAILSYNGFKKEMTPSKHTHTQTHEHACLPSWLTSAKGRA